MQTDYNRIVIVERDTKMAQQYTKYIFDELFVARKENESCNLKLICENRELWAHTLLLRTVSYLVRERESCELDPGKPLEITIPHEDNFACFDCASKFLDSLYIQNVKEIEDGHETHTENIISFLKIVDLVREFLYDSIVSHIPREKRNYCRPTTAKKFKKKVCKSKYDTTAKLKTSHKPASSKMQVCIECSFQCYRPADLLAHMTSTRHGKNVCSLCSLRSESTRQFDEHLHKHDNKKPFFCSTCEQRFATRALWTQHLPSHSTVAPFNCPHCPKAFKWKHGLNGHLITHTKDKKHLCDECGFSTTHAKTLRAHKLTHSGDMFRCTHAGCSHTSSRKENMNIHLRTHSKEKPFVCEICGLNFTQNKNLQRHSLIHAEGKEKVYSCLHCPFKALRSDYVKAHMQRQHTEKPLKLELCDNFADVLSMPDEQETEEAGAGGTLLNRSDLTVLADAASSRSRIDHSVSSMGEPVTLRNFDNLIANPTVSADEDIYLFFMNK